MPVGRIVGEFIIEDILKNSPDAIWAETQEYSGVRQEFYNDYFKGKKSAFAIKIANPVLYTKPIDPRKKDRAFVAPQSFKYLN
jgi:predicted transcriptional regulator